jgi:hypothetical protein
MRVPNVVVEWLTLLLHIRKVPDSDLGPETSFRALGFSFLFTVPRGECQSSAMKLSHDRFLSNSSFAYHPIIRRCVVLVTEKRRYSPIRIIIIIIIIIISCHKCSYFPGSSALEPVANPTTQASSLSL